MKNTSQQIQRLIDSKTAWLKQNDSVPVRLERDVLCEISVELKRLQEIEQHYNALCQNIDALKTEMRNQINELIATHNTDVQLLSMLKEYSMDTKTQSEYCSRSYESVKLLQQYYTYLKELVL